MRITFQTTLSGAPDGPTGIVVPPEELAKLGTSKKPAVTVDLSGYQYRSTVGVMGGACMVPVSAAHRRASGLQAGDPVTVTLELDLEPRVIEVPDDLGAALAATNTRAAFDALAFSKRREFVRQVEEAKSADTRQRRIEKIVAGLGAGGP